MMTKSIIGRVRDIEPNGAHPRLELFFGNSDLDSLPPQHKDEITLLIDGIRWTGTIGLKPCNDPYVHTFLRNGGTTRRGTEVFLALRLAEQAKLRFTVRDRGVLELAEVIHPGDWRPGGHPDHRRAQPPRARPRAPKSTPRPTSSRSLPAFPFEDREAVLRLSDLYWSKITAAERSEEQAFERELPSHRARGNIDKEMFVRLARWKSVRKTPDYEANSDEAVQSAFRKAFLAETDSEALSALTRLQGVAVRTASALLHWMVPHRFPILDVRVLSALGEPEPRSFEDLAFYTRIADRIRALARKLNVDLRTLDRALWTWDKVGSGSATNLDQQ